MPRVAKKKNVPANKEKNYYIMPESIPPGEVLTDLSKKQWRLGPSIGIGGFGEIYTAAEISSTSKKTVDYNYVMKIEPHANGPLFVEMHFYMRNVKMEQINDFCKKRGIKTLGMPSLIGSGSHEINGIKHRFIVIPRYGKDIWSFFIANNRSLPEHTAYRLALQMLDVYDYIHECTYVHGDLKGANILLGIGKGAGSQAYLVDFGLASHYTTKDYKPDPKKMHNGTIEYTSRDAHNGVPTMRGDLEILAYNLIHWLGASLPWEKDNLLANPVKVQKSKEEFMKSAVANLNQLFGKNVSEPLKQYLKYVESLEYNQKPEYDKCREMFQKGLKTLGKSNSGDLDLVVTKASKTAWSRTKNVNVKTERSESSEEEISETPTEKIFKKRQTCKRSPAKRLVRVSSPENVKPERSESSEEEISETPTEKLSKKRLVRQDRYKAASSLKKPEKTIVNDNITLNSKSSKTYEFNFELDMSLDANVILKINRRDRAREEEKVNEKDGGSPVPTVRLRKLTSSPSKGKGSKTTKKSK